MMPTAALPLVTRPRRLAACLLAALAGFSLPTQAQSLVQLYEAARQHDASYLAARAQFEASQAKVAQAGSRLLPTVGLSAGAQWSNTKVTTLDPGGNSTSPWVDTNAQSLTLGASQPLYRPGNRIEVQQAEHLLRIAQAQLAAAEQELIVRLSQAYFDVLAAQDSLTFVQAQKAAVEQQRAAAQRQFEVGAATITDTREAQARLDLVLAQELASDNDLRVKRLVLDQLVGRSDTQPWRLSPQAQLPALAPAQADAWLNQALQRNPNLEQARQGLDIARLETRKAEAARGPTLDAVAQYQVMRSPNTSTIEPYNRKNVATVGLQFNLPLYAGGALDNRVREAVALEAKAAQDLEAATRAVTQGTRAAFLGVQAGQGQVKALQAAEASSQSALDANQLGYQVGVRINIDVLNAQTQLYQTKAALAQARYAVLLGGLRLKQVSGVLADTDLQAIEAQLAP